MNNFLTKEERLYMYHMWGQGCNVLPGVRGWVWFALKFGMASRGG